MAKVEVEMPQMGESVMEGTIIEWTKKVGDQVEEDETLLEIATDKVDTEVPSPQAGILVEIKAEQDETVEVGDVIAVLETDAEEAKAATAGENSQEEQAAAEGQKEEDEKELESKEEEPDEGSGEEEGERVEVEMPQMGESVMEGTIIEWAKEIGDQVEEDETLLEIATDKVDTEVPSPQAGTLVEKLAEEDETIEVGQAIAVIATGKAAEVSTKTESGTKQQGTEGTEGSQQESGEKEETSTKGDEASAESEEPQRIGSDGRFYSPLVRSIAKEENISQQELESIEGSGQDGRVAKQDILNYLEKRESGKNEPQKAEVQAKSALSSTKEDKGTTGKRSISAGQLDVERPSESEEIIKMDRMRKMIAEHMIDSKKTSAHVTTFAEADVTNLVRWREANKQQFKNRSGIKLTFTPLFIEQIIQGIREFPLINSSIDLEEGEIHLKKDINFGIAVALGESGKGGLIVPVIKRAQEKNLVGLATEVNELAVKARNKDLNPDDLSGGTITLTNYGSVGNLMGTPIINQPQVAIFGTGAIEKRPVVLETEQGDVIAIRHMMYLSLSYDHRIIDGAHGGAFLNRVKQLLEGFDPERAV
jgi:2-oxoglutarate dehydrogenase E2 component (dihydrolipoamide succinyltransferase)